MPQGLLTFGLDSQGNVIAVPVGDYVLPTTSANDTLTVLNDAVEYNVPEGYQTASFDVRGTSVQTVVIEGSVDGTNWIAATGITPSNLIIASMTTYPQIFRVFIAGFTKFRLRTSAFTSGSVTVICRVSTNDVPGIASGLPVDSELSAAATLSDVLANPSVGGVGAYQMVFNGTQWERYRGSENRSVLASAARTATPAATDVITYNARTLIIFVNVTVGNATGLNFGVDIKDNISGAYHSILDTAALIGTAAGLWVFVIGSNMDDAPMTNNRQVVKFPVPRTIRIRPTHPGAGSITYSVSVDLID